uniref:Uncharacterized protein n=1 Tax=Hyaloperonospora arabidopsidis (strain Emoy2) TaxID=559515 RepID=M4BLT1_HYAAE
MAKPLLQLVTDTDSSGLSESDLIHHVEDVKRQLRDSWWRSAITRDSFAIGVCHVTSQVVGYLVQHRPVLAPARTSQWQKRVFLLETAVTSAFTSLQGAKSKDLAVLSEENRDFCIKYSKLLNRLYGTSQLPAQAVAVMTKVGILLAISWLSYDRVGKVKAVEKLLIMCTDFCLEHKSVQEFQKWPQFLLGMVQMVEKQDHREALQCFRNVVEKCRDAANAADDSVFFYWYAVVLIHNGLFSDAVDALDECIRANYEPVACLSLQAFANVKMQDYHAATEHLERALQIDCTHSGSLVNYSLLMEQMGNIDMQQQLLEAVLNSREGVDNGQTQRSDAADIAGTPTSFTALFEDACLASLSLSRRMGVLNTPTVHHHLALAAMENGG